MMHNPIDDDSGPSTHSITLMINQLGSDDEAERGRAEVVIYERYTPLLVASIRRRLDDRVRRREDEEDVAVVAFEKFFARVRRGGGTPKGRDELRKLLIVIALRRLVNVQEWHGAAIRDVRREVQEDASSGLQSPVDLMEAPMPLPDMEAAANEAVDLLLSRLSDQQRVIALRTLEGWQQREIAQELDVSTRTVQRALDEIRKLWDESMDG